MSFRNRCRIAGAEGVIDLSIPLVGGRDQKTLMKEVRVSDEKGWRARHWKTIVSCYSRSPWFEHYREGLEDLYRRPSIFLVDWNLACFEWSMKALGMTRGVTLTDRYQKLVDPVDGADWRGKIVPGASAMGEVAGATEVQGGMAGAGDGQGAMSGGAEGQGVAGEPVAPRYRQVFEERIGFIPDLSILDLLFCEGKNAIRYIQS